MTPLLLALLSTLGVASASDGFTCEGGYLRDEVKPTWVYADNDYTKVTLTEAACKTECAESSTCKAITLRNSDECFLSTKTTADAGMVADLGSATAYGNTYIYCTKNPPCDGGDSCCTSSNQCNVAEGDCDSDADCKGEAECNNSLDNCNGATYDATDDCCACLGGDTCCTAENPCNVAEGDCDSDADCKGEAQCHNCLDNCKGASFDDTDDCCACLGGNTCCTPTNPCTLGEGDCDSNADCKGEAECNNDLDNCVGKSFDDTDDCCACLGGDTCCTPADPCAVGEGDCDSDADCEGSSTCGTNNCNGSTFDSTDDCCE